MTATAILSFIVSNTATTLIMIPIAVAVLHAARIGEGETDGFPGALAMGIAFAASLGGRGTMAGSPPNAIAAGLIARSTGDRKSRGCGKRVNGRVDQGRCRTYTK